jgi:predicted SprT family Zn-dependent metalloprotease
MIRTYPEIQQVVHRIKQIVRKYIPDAEVQIVPSDTVYAETYIPPLRSKGKKVIIRFSQTLVESGTWEQIENTLVHEIAHVLQGGTRGHWHTEEWGDIARALGGTGEMDYYPDVLSPPRYKYRCADCGYTTYVTETPYRIPEISFGVLEHGETTGHRKWYVLDELTGRRWTKTY